MIPATASTRRSDSNKKQSEEGTHSLTSTNELTTLLADLTDYQYRQAYVEAHAKDTIAFQLRRMRLAEDWEQKDVASRMGNPKLQPMISRYENPDYGRYSITTLLELAKVFDVALVVRFARFSELARWDLHKTNATLQPASYAEDIELRAMATEDWMWRSELRTDDTPVNGACISASTGKATITMVGNSPGFDESKWFEVSTQTHKEAA
jgi:transcriptional regulator with XRE-family HTH domain